jgi:TonB family C-terminal domain
VRSMLIAPITGKKETVGIIEVFSAKPNAFSEQEIKTLEALAGKISDSVEATEENVKTPPIVAKESDAFSQKLQALSEPTTTVQVEDSPEIAEEPQKRDVLTTILVMAVIAVSLLLGLLLGVRFGINGAGRGKQAHSGEASSNGAHAPSAASGQYKAASSADSVTQKTSSSAKAVAHSSGGLTVTENGKVIYRAGPSEEAAQTEGASSGPVHRIDPQYPEAARSRRIEGPVVLNAQILEDGTVGTINIVQGDPILAEAATQAVKQWKYRPNIVGGRPVTRQETITVTFKLPSS